MKWLVKFEDNWADEMDLQGLMVMDDAQFMSWARAVEWAAAKIDDGGEMVHWFGTNENLVYSRGRDLKDAFTCEVISNEAANIIQQMVIGEGLKWYGHFITESDLNYFIHDEDN